LRLIEAVEDELRSLKTELRRFARSDRRCIALQTIYGVGPILACHLLAELGEAARFRRARQAVLASLEVIDFRGCVVLCERAVGESLWEAILSAELRELPAELRKVDEVLDEDRFMAPFRSRLTATIGRPTIPVETYLRLMYLKHR
jgi:hypothetical protein